jgi:hypothetical protein
MASRSEQSGSQVPSFVSAAVKCVPHRYSLPSVMSIILFIRFWITYPLQRNTLLTHKLRKPDRGQRIASHQSQLVLSWERVGKRETHLCAFDSPEGWHAPRPRNKAPGAVMTSGTLCSLTFLWESVVALTQDRLGWSISFLVGAPDFSLERELASGSDRTRRLL